MCSARHSAGLATGECSCRTNPDNIHTGCLWNIVVKLVSTYSSSLFPFPAMAMERILVVPLATFVLHQPATPPHRSQPNVTDLKRMLRAFHPAVHTLFYSLTETRFSTQICEGQNWPVVSSPCDGAKHMPLSALLSLK